MRSRLAAKISVAIVGVIGLALSSNLVALLASWHINGLMQDTVTENLSSLRAAEELEVALLEKQSLIVSFILDNENAEQLQELQRKTRVFHDALGRARKTAHTSSEKKILSDLEETYGRYSKKRNEIITLYQDGDREQAVAIFLNDVSSLSRQLDRLSRNFVAENKRYINATTARAQRQVSRFMWLVAGLACLTIGLCVLIAWFFFHGVLLPLRKMLADARDFTGARLDAAAEMPIDELPAVGEYLRSLMCNVSDTRSALAENRRRLMNAEKLAVVGKLAAGVAHEIRNPLTAIKMWLFSIRKAVGHDPELDRKFDIVAEETTRLEGIVRNFLEFSRPPALKLESQSVSSLMERTLDLFHHRIQEKKLRVTRDDAEHLPLVRADADQLKQVFINMLDNAVEATNEGGEIQIAMGTNCQPENRSMVVVRVCNSGRKIPRDVRAQIFEPFYTTKDDGTGLGLCIAVQIMARHEGRLLLESSTEQGTTFAVWIPIARNKSHEQNPGS